MKFIDLDIECIIQQLEQLNQETQPKWGKMSAQRMVEHLSDSVRMSTNKSSFPLEIHEDRIGRMQDFLTSDKPMMKNAWENVLFKAVQNSILNARKKTGINARPSVIWSKSPKHNLKKNNVFVIV